MDFFGIISLISGATLLPSLSSLLISYILKKYEKSHIDIKDKPLTVDIKNDDGETKQHVIDLNNYEQVINLLKEINKSEGDKGEIIHEKSDSL